MKKAFLVILLFLVVFFPLTASAVEPAPFPDSYSIDADILIESDETTYVDLEYAAPQSLQRSAAQAPGLAH